MRVSCSCPIETATPTLEGWIRQVGLEPIVTNTVIRCVYEGDNQALGDALVQMFEHEYNHEITVDYNEKERRKALRKAERAVKNAKLHGH